MKLFVILSILILNLSGSIFAKQNPCVFCREEVLKKQSVFESQYFNVLVDYEPRVKGHLLIIPKRHMEKAHELVKEEWEELSTVIPKVVRVFSQYLGTDQYIILEKNGPKAFQQVPHVHFHLFPVSSQTWGEIFDIIPKQLNKDDLEKERAEFQSYFLIKSSPPS